ncbi:unnamed protein product [Calypogeia fissa]
MKRFRGIRAEAGMKRRTWDEGQEEQGRKIGHGRICLPADWGRLTVSLPELVPGRGNTVSHPVKCFYRPKVAGFDLFLSSGPDDGVAGNVQANYSGGRSPGDSHGVLSQRGSRSTGAPGRKDASCDAFRSILSSVIGGRCRVWDPTTNKSRASLQY